MKKPLSSTGSVSHQHAIDKTKKEFRKYRLKTLSPVEKAYLANIKTVQKKMEKGGKENEQN
ncbi:MAG: hypothetical protein KBA24_06675 [Dysgonomonadaceae bacterium]|nr:hypothetical protein [Dysgonamonadaceae bacterium]